MRDALDGFTDTITKRQRNPGGAMAPPSRSVSFFLFGLAGGETHREREKESERERKVLIGQVRAYHFISMLRLAHPAVYETNGKLLSNGWFMISSDWREG